jgi:hypothetical protein
LSKPIRSYPKEQQAHVIKRRLVEQSLGLGFVSALEAKTILDAKKEAEQNIITGGDDDA